MRTRSLTSLVLFCLLALPTGVARAQDSCPGDCDGDGVVTVNEIITLVNIALGDESIDVCPNADVNGDGTVPIGEIIAAVQAALNGCPMAPPLCPAFTVVPRTDTRVLSGPGLLVQPNGAFVIATGSTSVTTGSAPRASGELRLHRYAANAGFLGQDTLVSRQRIILAPALARLPNAGGMAVWGEANPRQFGAPSTRLAVRRFGSNGRPLGGPGVVTSVAASHQLSDPSLSTDANGNALIGWLDTQQVGTSGAVFTSWLRQQRPTGLLAPQAIDCVSPPYAIAPGTQLGAACIAIDLAPAQVTLRTFVLESNIPMTAFDVDAATSPLVGVGAVASSDRLVAVWSNPIEVGSNRSLVTAQVLDLDGTPLTAPREVGTTVTTPVAPVAAVLPDGSFAVAFGESPLRLQRFAADGSRQGEPLVIADTRIDALALAGDGAGNLVVAWRWIDVQARLVRAPGGVCP
ncbi:MAG: hypothetical protein SF182_12925 [Deltaproteobacteria bacterium]|nr:hypothetical protein [Deltaproteobacteria bacterium]